MDPSSKPDESMKNALAIAASIVATAMLVRSLVNEVLPCEVRGMLSGATGALRAHCCSRHTVVVEQMEGFSSNLVYGAVGAYLTTRITTSVKKLRVSKLDNERKNITISLERGEEMVDVFEGIQFKGQLISRDARSSSDGQSQRDGDGGSGSTTPAEICSFELSFHKKYKDVVFATYLPRILERAEAIKAEDRMLKLYMNEEDYWNPINRQQPNNQFDNNFDDDTFNFI